MNTIQIGKEFENIAEGILKSEGFDILQRTSANFWGSPYDFIVKRNNKEYYLEVRGRKNGKYINYFSFRKSKLNYLKNLDKRVLILCINKNGYLLFDIKDIGDFVSPLKINDKTLFFANMGKKYLPKKIYNPCEYCHGTLKALYYREVNKKTKIQDWVRITNFKVCQECGEIFKINYEKSIK